jgi:ribosomal-protein-alanine N-acetyltransferase
MDNPTAIGVHIRYMIRRDMPEVLEIENGCFPFPWSEEDFIHCLRQHNTIGMVCEYDEQVVGFMIYERYKHSLRIINFAVKGECQRHAVGSQMIDKLINKLSPDRRRHIYLTIMETNAIGLSFFKEMGFKAHALIRTPYEETGEDGIDMFYMPSPTAYHAGTWDGKNRVEDFFRGEDESERRLHRYHFLS